MVDYIFSGKNQGAPVAYCEIRAMHSRLEMLLVAGNDETARKMCSSAEETVLKLDGIFDRHREDSPVARLNACSDTMDVPEELFFALELCEQFRLLTDGWFDITAAGGRTGGMACTLDPQTHSARRRDSGVILDFGGFAKGYALEVIRRQLEDAGVKSALLNFGNSSVLGIGSHPCGPCWQVRTENGGRNFELKDSALSVSGRNRLGAGHIFNPHTGLEADGGNEVSVCGRSALVCEMLSTAIYAATDRDRDKIIESFEGYRAYYGS